jgi:hypothetical protein
VRVVGVYPFFVTQPSFGGFWPDRSCPAFFIIKPLRISKSPIQPVGIIRGALATGDDYGRIIPVASDSATLLR